MTKKKSENAEKAKRQKEQEEWVNEGVVKAPKEKKVAQKAEVEEQSVRPTKKAWGMSGWRLVLWGIGMCVWIFAVLIAVQLLAGLFVTLVLVPNKVLEAGDLSSPVFMTTYQAILYAISLVVAILVPWKVLKYKVSRGGLGLEGLPTWADILLAPIGLILSLIVAAGLMAIMQKLLPGINWEEEQDVGFNLLASTGDYILAFTALVIVAPICEEVIFRGWLYGKLRARMKALPAILLTSVTFGAVHLQWNVGVTVFVLSIFMCLLRELTGTIYAGILVHMLKNGMAFYLLYVSSPFLNM